jgi:hypothetical protein
MGILLTTQAVDWRCSEGCWSKPVSRGHDTSRRWPTSAMAFSRSRGNTADRASDGLPNAPA